MPRGQPKYNIASAANTYPLPTRKRIRVRLARLEEIHGSKRRFTLTQAKAIINKDLEVSRNIEEEKKVERDIKPKDMSGKIESVRKFLSKPSTGDFVAKYGPTIMIGCNNIKNDVSKAFKVSKPYVCAAFNAVQSGIRKTVDKLKEHITAEKAKKTAKVLLSSPVGLAITIAAGASAVAYMTYLGVKGIFGKHAI